MSRQNSIFVVPNAIAESGSAPDTGMHPVDMTIVPAVHMPDRKRVSGFLAVLLMLALALPFSCSKEGPGTYRKTKPMMDTLVTVTVVADSDGKADSAIEKAFSVIERFGDKIDFFKETSELSAINRNAGIKPVKVSPETLDIIEKAIYVAEKSDGAFDPTIGPEIGMWDFAKKIKPSDEAVRNILPLVGYRKIVIDREKSTVFLKVKGMKMDLGGIAKGYAADLAVDELRRDGITAGIVANAGDIRTFGLKPDGKPWSVGIRNPRQKGASDELFAKAQMSDKAISTSGDYERYFISGGKRYHHILDPRTGFPAGLSRSVTVIAGKGAFTDSFSTAVFVLGLEKGMRLLQETGMEGIIIDASGGVHATAGIKRIVTFEDGH